MKMQYELLAGGFGDQTTNASMVDLIKNMADGTAAHRAGALKFGLREGFFLSHPNSSASSLPCPRPRKGKKG